MTDHRGQSSYMAEVDVEQLPSNRASLALPSQRFEYRDGSPDDEEFPDGSAILADPSKKLVGLKSGATPKPRTKPSTTNAPTTSKSKAPSQSKAPPKSTASKTKAGSVAIKKEPDSAVGGATGTRQYSEVETYVLAQAVSVTLPISQLGWLTTLKKYNSHIAKLEQGFIPRTEDSIRNKFQNVSLNFSHLLSVSDIMSL
jgi:hypothetical protein